MHSTSGAESVLVFPPVLFENKPVKVMVEFSLEQPKGGVHFVIPPGTSPDNLVRCTCMYMIHTCTCTTAVRAPEGDSLISVLNSNTYISVVL